jgi:hypothetical protein
MKKVVLQFRTILDLVDFASVISPDGHTIDYSRLTITGHFEEADIELAKAGYKANVIEEFKEWSPAPNLKPKI